VRTTSAYGKNNSIEAERLTHHRHWPSICSWLRTTHVSIRAFQQQCSNWI